MIMWYQKDKGVKRMLSEFGFLRLKDVRMVDLYVYMKIL